MHLKCKYNDLISSPYMGCDIFILSKSFKKRAVANFLTCDSFYFR